MTFNGHFINLEVILYKLITSIYIRSLFFALNYVIDCIFESLL